MMWRHRDRRSVWSLLPIWVPLFLLVTGVQVQAQQADENTSTSSTSSTSSSSSSSTSSSSTTITATDATRSLPPSTTAQSTCESRTVNYITHTLPQQCLTTTHSSTPVPSAESGAPAAAQTPAASPSDAGPPKVEEEHELDSDGNDLSTGAFMSFEEWKEMMLKKAGQEPMEARTRKPHDGRGDYPGGDLSSIGEEGEISLDFDAYSDKISEITSSGKPVPKQKKEKEDAVEKITYDEGLAHVYRSKDAGKTCKERYSYSSFDAGATVIKTSKGAKNSKAILVENKDSYMLLECATANKFFIVELSEDILVDTVVLANYEFFSSMIRMFRVSVSDRYPIKSDKWKVLGDFQARNSRDIQPFLIQNPQIWARYLRIEILSHYGNEFYCPLSLLRVHGTRMLDSWKEADPADFEEEEPSKAAPEPVPEAEVAAEAPPAEEPQVIVEVDEPIHVEDVVEQSLVLPFWDGSYLEHELQKRTTCKISEPTSNASSSTAEEDHMPPPESLPKVEPRDKTTDSNKAQAETARPSSHSPTTEPTGSAKTTSTTAPTSASSAAVNSTEGPATPKTSAHPVESTQSSGPPIPSTKHTVPASVRQSSVAAAKSKAAVSSSVKPPSPKATQNSKASAGGSSAPSRNRTTTPTSSAPASGPTVQDSFFKHLTKRLQTLESNTTLSLQYIESQSQFLQQALSKLERRQVAKVDLFLDTLNKTVLSELRDLRVQYDQIWQSTVIALETQRDQSERELLAVSSRLGALADEVVFQKRMAIVQSVLLLGCLFLVIFSGRLANGGVELYYPSQFLAGGGGGPNSRMGSPMYPSTPKAGIGRGGGGGRHQERSPPTGLRHSIEDSDMNNTPPQHRQHKPLPSLPADGVDDDHRSNDSMRQSIEERTPTPEPDTRRAMSEPHITQERLHPIRAVTMITPASNNNRTEDDRRPPNKRAVSDSVGPEYYQPPTPASLQDNGEEQDMGYDSEPNMPRDRHPTHDQNLEPERNGERDADRDRDYFCPSHSQSRRNSASSHHHLHRPSSSSSSLANEDDAATTAPLTSSTSATPTTAKASTTNPTTASYQNQEGSSERHNDGVPSDHHTLPMSNGGHSGVSAREGLQNGMESMIEGGHNGVASNNTMAEPSHRAARPPISHTGSLRKPLPSLPEDPDPDPDSDMDSSSVDLAFDQE
ncbi:hypothetical protein PG985_010192 [Apiospora marii]|uniref:SUN domain-containing protein n=1 Tax=Apiospora marii TaxID=335849 RepID=A0ABR1RLA2_9PEZI